MFLELFGCPGAGKTFLLNNLKSNCQIGVSSECYLKNIAINFCKKIVPFLPFSLVLKYKLLKCIKTKCIYGKYLNKNINYFLDSIIMVVFGYQYLNKNKVIIVDEGIIHRVTTLSVNFGLGFDEVKGIINTLKKYLKKNKFIYLDVPIDICFKSAINRKRKKCEMDYFDQEKLLLFITDYKKYFDYICDYYSFFKITRTNFHLLEGLIK